MSKFVSFAANMIREGQISKETVYVNAANVIHVSGTAGQTRLAFMGGGELVIEREPEAAMRDLEAALAPPAPPPAAEAARPARGPDAMGPGPTGPGPRFPPR